MQLSSIAPINACKHQIPALTKPVFVADIHLSKDKPATTQAFFNFLKLHAVRFNELLILGDLFEFWAGDDQIGQYENVVQALKQYHMLGKIIYIMHGNRDFLLGEDFAQIVGAELISDPICTTAGYERILLSHGDAWCSRDADYQQFRHTLRSAETQLEILKEKLNTRLELANGLRSESKHENDKKKGDVMDVVVNDVAKAAHLTNTAIIIHGHTHRAAHHTHVIDDFRFDRWVLPDWNFEGENRRGGFLSFEDGYLHFSQLD